ncbi:LETM1-related biofilm-associated protein [Flavobacterium rhizosphaerae]|uniref:LETM1-related biofilm-associated protein n=1 Tax=Flavobacterium rhizosphaerae TaxID=3163298 RepID=A0ABW8YU02_9FLAO
MINPSASGWIDKFFSKPIKLPVYKSPQDFYNSVRDTGFIYGHVIDFNSLDFSESREWNTEEITKAGLLNVLYEMYRMVTTDSDIKNFTAQAAAFYKQMQPEGFSINLFKKVLGTPAPARQLEEILDARVKTNDNIISRNFSHILINALLFMDVLAFERYLQHEGLPQDYLRKLEETVTGLISVTLKTKALPTKYDRLLIKLFEASVRYIKFSDIKTDDLNDIPLDYFTQNTEKLYLLDMAGMAIWSDVEAQHAENNFIYTLASRLGLSEAQATESIASFAVFLKIHRHKIPYFKYSNPVKHFYEHATQNVMLLVNRNRKRLVKEISNNGELVLLLTHSTHRSLDKKEKKKIKKQLLEICKTVPSLAIFLLPGGSLLLPLLIKLIPQMLPSIFNENLEQEDSN